jgi:hypothetical protein
MNIYIVLAILLTKVLSLFLQPTHHYRLMMHVFGAIGYWLITIVVYSMLFYSIYKQWYGVSSLFVIVLISINLIFYHVSEREGLYDSFKLKNNNHLNK